MTRVERELDEYGKRILSPLQAAPPSDPRMMAEEKARFLLKGEDLRNNLIPKLAEKQQKQTDRQDGRYRGFFSTPIYKALAIAVIVLVLITASSITVFAAQSSLPGDPLYTIKSISEDIRLSLTFSTEDKLDLTLDYANHRVDEIQGLVSQGKSLPEQTSERYQRELEQELELAAQLDDQQLQSALIQIKAQAESQGMTVEELITHLPNQASPAIMRLQERLREQVQLSTIGEQNPQAFRKEIHAREHGRQGPRQQATEDEQELFTTQGAITPAPDEENTGNGMGKPTGEPGQSNPGNGNHTPNPTHTPKP